MTNHTKLRLIPYDVLMQRVLSVPEHKPSDWWWAVALTALCLPIVIKPLYRMQKRTRHRRSSLTVQQRNQFTRYDRKEVA